MHEILTGDVMHVLPTLHDASVDAVLTDPPYGLSDHRKADIVAMLTAWLAGEPYQHGKTGFMGRSWDSMVPGPECWREVLRVLRPGSHALVFAAPRTMDLMAIALRLAGFEIRDCIRSLNGQDHYPAWVYGSGFPKNKLHLKPAWEPVIVARKPMDGTIAQNITKHGVGGLNINGCRVPFQSEADESKAKAKNQHGEFGSGPMSNAVYGKFTKDRQDYCAAGRFPANVIHDGSPEVLAEFAALPDKSRPGTRTAGANDYAAGSTGAIYGKWKGHRKNRIERHFDDSGTAARFFWSAKANGNDRWFFCPVCGSAHPKRDRAVHQHGEDGADHIVQHPTVKPTSLTEYLARLVLPPAGIGRPRRIIVPFAGTGSEMVGALRAGWDEVIGIEQDAEYAAIAEARCQREVEGRAAAFAQPTLFDTAAE